MDEGEPSRNPAITIFKLPPGSVNMEPITHLSKDKKIKKLIDPAHPYQLKKRKHIHLHLCSSIMSQQLSTKVADVIQKRFMDLYGGKTPTPEMILIPPEKLRAIGLSNAKTNYVHNVARFALEKGLDYRKLDKMGNEEVITYITSIKGVGKMDRGNAAGVYPGPGRRFCGR